MLKCTYRTLSGHSSKGCFWHDQYITKWRCQKNIDQQENSASIFRCKIWKSPDISQSYCRTCNCQHITNPSGKASSVMVMCRIVFFFHYTPHLVTKTSHRISPMGGLLVFYWFYSIKKMRECQRLIIITDLIVTYLLLFTRHCPSIYFKYSLSVHIVLWYNSWATTPRQVQKGGVL